MLLPKVLIINQPFVNNTGGGITLSNLFSNWDRESLAVACSGYLFSAGMDPALCNTYYQIGSKERKWIFPFNLISRKYYSGSFEPSEKLGDKVVVDKSKFRDKLILNYALPFLEYMGFDHFKAKSGLSSQFCSWLDDFDPAIIYAQAYTREDVLFCLELKKYLKHKPLIFHMMDDWLSTVGGSGLMKNYWKRKINSEFQNLIGQTDLALSISDFMGEEYKRRYGKDFTTFHNSIELNFWKKAQKTEYDLSPATSILYAGRVGLGIDESLKRIARAVDKVNQDLGIKIKFLLQTQKRLSWIKNYDCTEHRNFVDYEELPKVFAESDFLILPYDFNSKSLSFIKYSMPTKAPEYMASGVPIIVFAPEDTALVNYARKYEWAAVVSKNSVEELANLISKLIKEKALRQKIAETAKNIAAARHDSKIVAMEFRDTLLSVLSKTNRYSGGIEGGSHSIPN